MSYCLRLSCSSCAFATRQLQFATLRNRSPVTTTLSITLFKRKRSLNVNGVRMQTEFSHIVTSQSVLLLLLPLIGAFLVPSKLTRFIPLMLLRQLGCNMHNTNKRVSDPMACAAALPLTRKPDVFVHGYHFVKCKIFFLAIVHPSAGSGIGGRGSSSVSHSLVIVLHASPYLSISYSLFFRNKDSRWPLVGVFSTRTKCEVPGLWVLPRGK